MIEKYKWAGQKVRLEADPELAFTMNNQWLPEPKDMDLRGAEYRVEDYWIRLEGESWSTMSYNPACQQYALRVATNDEKLLKDENVLYGKVKDEQGISIGFLIHESEIKELIE